MNRLRQQEPKKALKWLAMVVMLAVTVQGSQMSFSTMFCNAEGTTRLISNKGTCCESMAELPDHCEVDDKCCDVETETKPVFAHQRDLNSDDDTEIAQVPLAAFITIPEFSFDLPRLSLPALEIPWTKEPSHLLHLYCQYRL